MQIENEIRLDFNHVLIRPKRSPLISRSEVDLNREFKFLHSGKTWNGVPIIAANMDTIGTFEVAKELASHGLCTALHKHYNVDELVEFFTNINKTEKNSAIFYSMGVAEAELEKLQKFSKKYKNPDFLCIDVANGYSDLFIDHVARMRDLFPDTTIMAGNVVTPDIVYELIGKGADIAKIGIGPGCFPPGQKVRTRSYGDIPIEHINIGQMVLTHTGNWRRVIKIYRNDPTPDGKNTEQTIEISVGKFSDDINNVVHPRTYTDIASTIIPGRHDTLIQVNDIKTTPNHEFYVVHKKYANIVTDDNIEEYAEWIEAQNLTKDYMLVEKL